MSGSAGADGKIQVIAFLPVEFLMIKFLPDHFCFIGHVAIGQPASSTRVKWRVRHL